MSSSKIRLWTRREFLTRSLGVTALVTTIPSFLTRSAFAWNGPQSTTNSDEKILVVIQLSGGNDGLNTVIPFSQDTYYRSRPTIAIPADKVLRATDEIGFHPSLAPMKQLYDSGKLTVIQGVGYPNPDRSHFRSMDIWQSGIAETYENSGWIGRMFDHTCGNQTCSPTLGISIGDTLSPALNCDCSVGVALRDPEQFFNMTKIASKTEQSSGESRLSPHSASQLDFLRRTAMNAEVSADKIRNSVHSVQAKADYPKEPFAQGLKLIAAMIAGGMDTRVYYTSLSGFDTHANQLGSQDRLLKTLAEGLAAFQQDLEALGQAERVLGFTFSEFGRRVLEAGAPTTAKLPPCLSSARA